MGLCLKWACLSWTSVGICLNASKAEARLDMATLLLGLLFVRGRIGFGLCPGIRNLGLCLKCACLSYAFCGSAQAEAPCYLSSTDLSLPYPYWCPRSICPARLDVHTNLIDTDDYEDELQMAAATWDDASEVRVAPPSQFVAPQPEGEESQDQENIILAYDTADDGEDAVLDFSDSEASELLTAEGDADYPDVQIDWSAWISSMPSPVLID